MTSRVSSDNAPDSIPRPIASIRELQSDQSVPAGTAGYNRYTTQKAHWLGWLGDTPGTGSYGRKTPHDRGARHVYNHIVEPQMLLWLIEAAGIDAATVETARHASGLAKTLSGQSKAIRHVVPFSKVAEKLWPGRAV